MKLNLLFLLLLFSKIGIGQKNYIQISQQIRRERIDSISSLLNIKPFDKIADIGSGDGGNLIKLTKEYSTISIFAEDIDNSKCNRLDFIKQLRINKSKLPIDSIHFVYGTETSTTLPKKLFDKIILIGVVHEFNYRNEMLTDIKSCLTKNGQILIEEPLVIRYVKKDRGCNNPYLTEPELLQILAANHIHILKETHIKGNSDDKNYFRKAYLRTLD